MLSEGGGLGWLTSNPDPRSVESGVVSGLRILTVLKDRAGMGTRQGTRVGNPLKSVDNQLVQWVEEGETSFPGS